MSFLALYIAHEPVLNEELDDFMWLEPDGLSDIKVTGGLQEVIQSAQILLRARSGLISRIARAMLMP